MTSKGGSINGSAVQTNMSTPGSSFPNLPTKKPLKKCKISVATNFLMLKDQLPLHESIFESVAVDWSPTKDLSEDPVAGKPSLYHKHPIANAHHDFGFICCWDLNPSV